MKENFSIEKHRNNDILNVILRGDLDGSGAWELLNELKENCSGVNKVVIQTRFLNHLYPFGKDTVIKHLYLLERPLHVVDADKELRQIIIKFQKHRTLH